jgi:CBS domain containing-hemolysin-like protein
VTFEAMLLALYVGTALTVSFVCSILEATILSIRVTELEERREAGSKAAGRLLLLKQNRLDDAISAILILNTVAHTIGAALAGAQAAVVFGSAWVGVFSGILTLLVLLFTEIIPKTIGTAYASRLVPVVAAMLRVLTTVLAPLLILTRIVTRLIAPLRREPISRGELAALVSMATREGALETQQSRVFENVLELDSIEVEDVMTPRTVIVMLAENAVLGDLIDHAETSAVSRIPLFAGNRDQVTGYVLQREALLEAARGMPRETPLAKFRRDVHFLPETAPLSVALRHFLAAHEHLAMAVDEFGGVSGVVTLEDLLETILGVEIIDESDRVADLRHLAAELRDRRLARHRSKRLQRAGAKSTA